MARNLMVNADDLLLLAEVIEAGGFSAASTRCGIPKSRLSRRVAALEERLGVALLKRTSRQFEVTELGRRLYEQALQIRMSAQTAVTMAADSFVEPSGVLRVACPVALLVTLVSVAAVDFAKRYPRVRLCLSTTMGLSDLGTDRYDILLHPSTAGLRDSDIVAQRLVTLPFAVLGCEALAMALPQSDGPPTFDGLPAIGWNNDEPSATWLLVGPSNTTADVRVHIRFSSDNLLTIRDAALAGLGIARLPLAMCKDEIASRRLHILAPGWAPPAMSLYAVYLSRRRLGLAAQAFIDVLRNALTR